MPLLKFDIWLHMAWTQGTPDHWRTLFTRLEKSGLWSKANKIILSCQYSLDQWQSWWEAELDLRSDPRVELRLGPDDLVYGHRQGDVMSQRALGLYCQSLPEPRAIMRWHLKGLTFRGCARTEPVARQWQEYLEYWGIDQGQTCWHLISQGWDLAGANWIWDHPWTGQGHFSGNCWWAHSGHLASLEPLKDPRTGWWTSEFGLSHPALDSEYWPGRGQPRVICLHDHRQAVNYLDQGQSLPQNYALR